MAITIAALGIAGTSLATMGAAPVAAATLAPVTIPSASCNVRDAAHGYGRSVYSRLPVIRALDLTAGAGNDSQYVYYWVRMYDFATGTVLTDWAPGGGAWANDNAAAALPSMGFFNGAATGPSWLSVTGPAVRLQYYIGWYAANGTQLNWAASVVQSYVWWQFGYNIVQGTYDRC
jgi:hypothetical protein